MNNLLRFIIIFFISINFLNAQSEFKENTFDIYFGEKVNDPYRIFENTDNDNVKQWYKKETIYSKTIFDNIQGRDDLFEKFLEYQNKKKEEIYNVRITDNKEYFYLKENKEGVSELFYKKTFDGEEIFLYSPLQYKSNLDRNYKINYIRPSWDTSKIAISLSYEGKELSDIIILDIKKKKVLDDIITNTRPRSFFGVNWLPDNSGFTYLYFPNTDKKTFKKDSKAVLHILGDNNPKILLSKNTHPEIINSDEYFPTTVINSNKSQYIVAYLLGVDNYWDAYYTEIKNIYDDNVKWKPLYKKKDKIFRGSGILENSTYFYKTSKENSNFSIGSFTLENSNDKKEIIAFNNEVISDFIVTSRGILFTTVKNGIESKLYLKSKHLKEIDLPKKAGKIYLDGKTKKGNIVYLTSEGWTNSYIDYYFNVESKEFEEKDFVPNIKYQDFESIKVEEVEVSSYDGVLVPLTIIYDENIKKEGKAPTMITGYGAYGRSYKPTFSTLFLNFVTQGGVVAIAHVRGGGEKGEAWHKAGQKTTKPNTWKDLIACTEYLIKEKFTSPKHIAIRSGSAGGIMVGRAMIERPDLFAAVVSEVGQMNPSRSEFREEGDAGNSKEYGSVKNEIELKSLLIMDPYLNIQDKGVNYPATLVTAGANDPRIPVWIPGKFAARLKGSETQNPVLFHINSKSGHYGADSMKERYKQLANIYSFILWQTGHPDYQLKNN